MKFHYVTDVALVLKNGAETTDGKQAAEAYQASVDYYLLGGNSEPHFAITCDGYDRYRRAGEAKLFHEESGVVFTMCSAGCQHDVVRALFPKLAPFVQWHLSGPSGPMHYLANGTFWWDQWRRAKLGDPDPYDKRKDESLDDLIARMRRNFDSTVCFGALGSEDTAQAHPMDRVLVLSDQTEREYTKSWLRGRLPGLQAAFAADMAKLHEKPEEYGLRPR